MSAVQSVYLVLSGRLDPGEVSQAFALVHTRWKSARVVTSKETGGRHEMARVLAERVVLALPVSGVISGDEVLTCASCAGRVSPLVGGVFLRTWQVEPVGDESVAAVLRY